MAALDESYVVRASYDRLAPVYDAAGAMAERLIVARWRRMVWNRVAGAREILELGIGTGRNLPHHPPGAHVVGIDLSPAMLERARRRAQRSAFAIDLRVMDVQRLDLESESFDAVVATFLFCCVPDPVLGLSEARRVLRPSGTLVLLEHVRPRTAWLGHLADLLDPLAAASSAEHLNRRTLANVRAAGLRIDEVLELAPTGLVQLIVARAA